MAVLQQDISEKPTLNMNLPNSGIDELIDTNRALHAVVLELQDLLRNPMRLASYQEQPQLFSATVTSSQAHQPCRSTVAYSATDKVASTVLATDVSDDAILYSPPLRLTFSEENESARRRFAERRNAEMRRLKHWIDYRYISFPSSFYQREIQEYDQTRKYSGRDPYHWWTRLQKHLPHHEAKISEGPHVAIATTGRHRDELLDALFDFESTWPENLSQTLPLRELEHTYGYKLHRIKDASGSVRPSTELITEVGRFFQHLSRDMKDHSLNLSATRAVKGTYTLSHLYERCKDIEVPSFTPDDPLKERTLCLSRIWTVLRCLNHVAVLPEQLPVFDDDISNQFILDVLDNSYVRGATPQTPQVASPDDALHFSPQELCFKNLTDLGGLKIAWTNLYTQHLRLIRSSKTLLLFWDVSILGQSPLFSHWPQWMDHGSHPELQKPDRLHNYATSSVGLLKELQKSYRIIFGNPDGRFLDRFFRKHFHRNYDDDVGIVLHDLESIMLGAPRVRINVKRSSARQALKYYLRASIPPSILSLRPELDRKKHRGPNRRHNWHFLHNYNPLAFSFRQPTSGKLIDLLNAGPPYPLDFWMHISYLLELSRSTSLDEMERYSSYPIFGQRLRELQKYMEKQRPKNLRQLWKDRRDTVGYWAFWAVIVVGGLSIILALISIALSSAQLVAGFEAIGNPQRNSSS